MEKLLVLQVLNLLTAPYRLPGQEWAPRGPLTAPHPPWALWLPPTNPKPPKAATGCSRAAFSSLADETTRAPASTGFRKDRTLPKKTLGHKRRILTNLLHKITVYPAWRIRGNNEGAPADVAGPPLYLENQNNTLNKAIFILNSAIVSRKLPLYNARNPLLQGRD